MASSTADTNRDTADAASDRPSSDGGGAQEATTTDVAPPPPPPPPPPPELVMITNEEEDEVSKTNKTALMTAETRRCLGVLVSYPILVPQEESRCASPYDVMGWFHYMQLVDDLLDQWKEVVQEATHKKKKKAQTLQVGGQTVRFHSPSDLQPFVRELTRARLFVGERALALLPGSYKLWRCHLHFWIALVKERSYDKGGYRALVGALERSLVRLHKMPRIWLEYLGVVVQYDDCVTTVRRLFDRALLALPATQHALIWREYMAFVTQRRPAALPGATAKVQLGPVSCQIPANSDDFAEPSWCIPPETALRVLRRFAHCFDPTAREDLAHECLKHKRWGEAATLYLELLQDVNFSSSKGTSRHDLWMQLANLATQHAPHVLQAGVDFDAIVRAVLEPPAAAAAAAAGAAAGDTERTEDTDHKKEEEETNAARADATDAWKAQLGEMEGTLWKKLAEYHVQLGDFEMARSVYEEAMERVSRVRDFTLVFDAYMKFEEGVVEAMMALMEEEEEEEEDGDDDEKEEADEEEEEPSAKTSTASAVSPGDGDEEDLDILMGDGFAPSSSSPKDKDDTDDDDAGISPNVELALARADHLLTRRPLLLNRVLLRQNPHHVGEWIQRSKLFVDQLDRPREAVRALEEAIQTVSARRATGGQPCTLFLHLAKLHEEVLQNVTQARNVYRRVCATEENAEDDESYYAFANVDDLAQCFAAWVELELRHEQWDEALSISRQAVAPPAPAAKADRVRRSLPKSLRLWNLRLDLEESLGTVQTTKDAYNRAMELQVATPSHVLNFASFLSEHNYYEEAFTAYERGLELFAFPHGSAKLLWKTYLEAFERRFAGTKTPRMRELYQQCLETCPPEEASEFFVRFGAYEEQYGLTKRALRVYERMATTVPSGEKYAAYSLYIAKTAQAWGAIATRPLYERAIAALDDAGAAQMCAELAQLETNLLEFDRARTALTYGAQLADPRRAVGVEYWKKWHDFEVAHGNEETFREMLRVKRAVQAAFSTVNYNVAETTPATLQTLSDEAALDMIAEREGVATTEKPRIGGFVQAKRSNTEMTNVQELEQRAAKIRQVTQHNNNNKMNLAEDDQEIDLDDADEEEKKTTHDGSSNSRSSGDDDNVKNPNQTTTLVPNVTTKPVPAAVFGGLKGDSN